MNTYLINKDSDAAMSLIEKITNGKQGDKILCTKQEMKVINSGDLVVLSSSVNENRYQQALENIAAYVPYAFAQELAENALDLEAKLMVIAPVSSNSPESNTEELAK